jgi:hypothetical protein
MLPPLESRLQEPNCKKFHEQQKFPIESPVSFAATVFSRGSPSTPIKCVNPLVLKNACKVDTLRDCVRVSEWQNSLSESER